MITMSLKKKKKITDTFRTHPSKCRYLKILLMPFPAQNYNSYEICCRICYLMYSLKSMYITVLQIRFKSNFDNYFNTIVFICNSMYLVLSIKKMLF